MTVVDVIVPIIVLVFAVRGYRHGLTNELFTFLGWLVGAGLALRFTFPLAPPLAERLGTDPASTAAVVFAAILAGTYGAFWLVGWWIGRGARNLGPNLPNRLAGLVVGTVEGVALVMVLAFTFRESRALPSLGETIERSRIAAPAAVHGERAVYWARNLDVDEIRREAKEAVSGALPEE